MPRHVEFRRFEAWKTQAFRDELRGPLSSGLAGRFRFRMRASFQDVEAAGQLPRLSRGFRFEEDVNAFREAWRSQLQYSQINSLYNGTGTSNRAAVALTAAIDSKRIAVFKTLSPELEVWWHRVFEQLYTVDEVKYVNDHINHLMFDIWDRVHAAKEKG